MGLLTARHGNRKYVIELEQHLSRRFGRTELPVEKLDSIFFEGGFSNASASDVEYNLNQPLYGQLATGLIGGVVRLSNRKASSIFKRAEKSGTELWFGDVDNTTLENLQDIGLSATAVAAGGIIGRRAAATLTRREALKKLGFVAGGVLATSILPALYLTKRGNADKRTLAAGYVREFNKLSLAVHVRNKIVAHKIRALADKFGHRNVGLLFGAGHVGLKELLEHSEPLTAGQRAEIAKRGPSALKMFRCVYDKQAGKWRVEEHSL